MILQCVECKSRFLVNPTMLGADGRSVKCAKCGHTWFARPMEPEKIEPEISVLPLEDSAQRLRPIPPGSGLPVPVILNPVRKWQLAFAAVASLGLVLALLLFRPGITYLIPAAQSAYDRVGMYDTSGVALADITYEKIPSLKRDRYAINGYFLNESAQPRYVPYLRISLLDEKGDMVQYWDFEHKRQLLRPGESLPFHADKLDIRFSKADHFVLDIGNRFDLALRN